MLLKVFIHNHKETANTGPLNLPRLLRLTGRRMVAARSREQALSSPLMYK